MIFSETIKLKYFEKKLDLIILRTSDLEGLNKNDGF